MGKHHKHGSSSQSPHQSHRDPEEEEGDGRGEPLQYSQPNQLSGGYDHPQLPYGYQPQPPAPSGSYGYQPQPPAPSGSYGYQPQPPAPSGSYGYQPQPPAPSGSYGYQPQPPAPSGSYGYQPQPAWDYTPGPPPASSEHYGHIDSSSRPQYDSTRATGSGYKPKLHSAAQEGSNLEPTYFSDQTTIQAPPKAGSVLETFATGLNSALHDYARTLFPAKSTYNAQASAPGTQTGNRFESFATVHGENGIKWYVDGKDYMYAVSIALEKAERYIWILDWWLSPELYLRRPPSQNEKYRLDVMLQAAAARGVKINVIVYKEVTQALTLDSAHTKHALEALHPNISVFRHPDHLPDRDNVFHNTLSNIKAGKFSLGDGLKGIYDLKNDITLYYAHHEKLCLIDGQIAFMGGLDLCFGRFDTNNHPIADAHPGNPDSIIFPGQDFNNARYRDFKDVLHWDQNSVDRFDYSRMGWSDVSLSLMGPTVEDLKQHFIQRWNYIYTVKYEARDVARSGYAPLDESKYKGGYGYHRRYIKEKVKRLRDGYDDSEPEGDDQQSETGGVRLQICRSICEWSHGKPTEHSIANAYIGIISAAKHFVYIENQFFITATDPAQKPILNMIGRAIVDRIIRAHRDGERFRIVVVIPSIPGFAGDLQAEGSLGTRAIMEFQYRSIIRDRGYSICEQLEKASIQPAEYIRFYNLRNYDRINFAGAKSGEDQKNAPKVGGRWDSVSSCYMLGGQDIRSVPWEGDPEKEIEAFVSEELYVHTKLLIADDRVVIIGSANLNDRSQLGDHDSEIAVVVEDPTPLPSRMNGRPFTASFWAATLRRQLFRKHLGLIPAQGFETVDENMMPIPTPNIYDFDSPEDRLVEDPLSEEFWNFWNSTAKVNTNAFANVFHVVPDDRIQNWKQYEQYWSKHFAVPKKDDITVGQPEEKWGHVVRSQFSPGAQGAREVKDILSAIRGSLVEMPLNFLLEEDIAKEGLELNAITEPLYT